METNFKFNLTSDTEEIQCKLNRSANNVSAKPDFSTELY